MCNLVGKAEAEAEHWHVFRGVGFVLLRTYFFLGGFWLIDQKGGEGREGDKGD
jgi:hypothetical protein